MMNRILQAVLKVAVFALAVSAAWAEEVIVDSARVYDLDEVTVISSPKDVGSIAGQMVSVSMVTEKDMEKLHISNLKGVSSVVPNFFMPDYGSRMTSAMYIRGIGSRTGTPAVGLYVDNIPYSDKSAFDFSFYDVERVDVLRGPQGTLYGRNTMGGLVRVYTHNPFSYTGTDVKLGFASQDSHRNISLTHYHRISDAFAFSAGGYYEAGNGFFRHSLSGHEIDDVQAGGGRLRAIYLPSSRVKLGFSLNYDYSDDGAYPYYYEGMITCNREGRYRRGMLNAGLNAEYQSDGWVMNAVTGFQSLSDRMFMDQDFVSQDLYTLLQKQSISTFSEELTFRNKIDESQDGIKWKRVSGLSFMYQWLHTDAPVTFYGDGIKSMIEDNVNGIFSELRSSNPRMPDMALDVTDEEFSVKSDMRTPSLNAGLFHQSTLSFGDFSLTLGARLEYEHLSVDYLSDTRLTYAFNINPYASYPGLLASPSFCGSMKDDDLQFLPKVAVRWCLPSSDANGALNYLYASLSKGYRSGGYNVQMFSDLVQGEMKNQMMDGVNEVSKGMMERFVDMDAVKSAVEIGSIRFRPEYSWNWEVGGHASLGDVGNVDFALFHIRTYDQQIARFASSGLGRMMVNAGRSESYGAELTVNLMKYISLSYGYTHAKFTDYDAGDGSDYTDNYVPFIPRHTLNVMAELPIGFSGGHLALFPGIDWSGQGKIFWTEDNSLCQSFYNTWGAHLRAELPSMTVSVWAKNIGNAKYDTFCFVSAGRVFEQYSKPFQFGVDMKLHF